MDLMPKEIMGKHYFLFQPKEACFPWHWKVHLTAASLPSFPEQQSGQKSLLLLWNLPHGMKVFEWKELPDWLHQKYLPLSPFIKKKYYPCPMLVLYTPTATLLLSFVFSGCVCVCFHVYICVFAWMYVCLHTCTNICTFACIYVYMCVFAYALVWILFLFKSSSGLIF